LAYSRKVAGSTSSIVANNPNSDRAKRYRALVNQASARRRTGLFVVEGPQAVRELVGHYPDAYEAVYMSEAAAQRYQDIVTLVQSGARLGARSITQATPEYLKAISENAQGILAVAKTSAFRFAQPITPPLSIDSLCLPHFHSDGTRYPASLISILHNVRDPGNAGTVIRAADAMGSDLTILTGDSVEITNPKVVRSSAGSLFHGALVAAKSLPDVVKSLQTAGWQVLAAAGNGTVELTDPALNLAQPTAWIFGNEAWGLRPDDAALADHIVRIPMYGAAESLNLATAAAICLFATASAQHAPGGIAEVVLPN